MKRNILNEIQDLKKRSNQDSKFFIENRLQELQRAYDDILYSNLSNELLKHIPIAIVACYESFFKVIASDLINLGEPYSNNVVKFNQSKDIRFDFEIVKAIQSKSITTGEFISHILPFNNFNDINTNISIIIDKDFLDEIKTYSAQSIHIDVVEMSKEFVKNSDSIIKDIKRTYELRHIFCHEFAHNFTIDKDEISRCLLSARLFLNQVDRYILTLINPNYVETQTEMNIQSYENFSQLEDKLNSLIVKFQTASKEAIYEFDISLFNDMVNTWRKFRELKSMADAYHVKGGSMYPLLLNGSKSATTQSFINQLQNQYDNILALS